jgi:hypothetical protein
LIKYECQLKEQKTKGDLSTSKELKRQQILNYQAVKAGKKTGPIIPSGSLTFSTEISLVKSFSKIFLVMQKVSWMSILLIYCK